MESVGEVGRSGGVCGRCRLEAEGHFRVEGEGRGSEIHSAEARFLAGAISG